MLHAELHYRQEACHVKVIADEGMNLREICESIYK